MCALYGSARDVSLIKKINEELIIDIIDTEVLYYKLVLGDTKPNLYGESDNKQYYNPVNIHTLINREEQSYEADEFGVDHKATARFAFLRDRLVEFDLYAQPGDIIEWDNEYYEVDGTPENQYFAGKNPATWLGGGGHGYNISIICDAHITRRDRLNLVDTNVGLND